MSTPVVITTIPKNSREQVGVAFDHYRGTDLVDVHIVTPLTTETRTLVPTKKGVGLRLELLLDLIKASQEAEPEARRRGLLMRSTVMDGDQEGGEQASAWIACGAAHWASVGLGRRQRLENGATRWRIEAPFARLL